MKNPEKTPRPLDLQFKQAVKALHLTEPFTDKPITEEYRDRQIMLSPYFSPSKEMLFVFMDVIST